MPDDTKSAGTMDEDVTDDTDDDEEIEEEDEEFADDEDDETLGEVLVVEDAGEPSVARGDDAGVLSLHLTTDIRRRLRRRAEREGVTAEELAEELLSAAVRRPMAESVTDLSARLDKLERTVTELAAQRNRADAPAPRPETRPRSDQGVRPPFSNAADRGFRDRPAYNDRGGFAGNRRPDDRPRFGDRPSGGFGRSEDRFGDRPRGDFGDRPRADFAERPRGDVGDRGAGRGFDRRNDRNDDHERPPRRWESPRRGE